MKIATLFGALICGLLASVSFQTTASPPQTETVVLLHGLARSSNSMVKLEKQLIKSGYQVCNINYPSTKFSIEKLSAEHIAPQIQSCRQGDYNKALHFVTHSMGGIILRYLAKHKLAGPIGRVVMLGPPNKGSEVVDKLGKLWLFERINGPAGAQLGTDKNSLPNRLGRAPFELGIISGSKSINPILSLLIDGKDDGKVSVEKAKLTDMKDFLVVENNHTFLMRDPKVIQQCLHFLQQGYFKPTP